jgi:hypothetical protein
MRSIFMALQNYYKTGEFRYELHVIKLCLTKQHAMKTYY